MKKSRHIFIIILTITMALSIFFDSAQNVLAQTELGWTEPINLSNSGSSTRPLIITDTDGAIHVIWVDKLEGYKYVEKVNGVEWSTPVNLEFPFSPDTESPRFEVTADGMLHVFWRDDENRLYHSKSPQTNFGTPALWESSVLLGDSVVDYDVAADSVGSLHISLIKNDGPNNEPAGVYYRSLLNGGASWSGMQSLFESPYFRSLTSENAHVRVAVSNNAETENVYVAWDNLALKRIFMSKSRDQGQTWGEAYELIGPESNLGNETPYNIEIDTINNGVLLTWQTGESGIRCSQYSRWSDDGGNEWGEIMRMFDEIGVCPERIGFQNVNGDYAVVVLNLEGSLALIAWNGSVWSNLQIQNGLTSLSNPATFDPLLFHCQHISLHDEQLLVVGCDDGGSEDIWFSSRLLGSVESWFPPPSAWSSPQVVVNVSHQLSSISSVTDSNDNIHIVWVQSPLPEDNIEPAIYYALWNGNEWSRPAQIMANTNGVPIHLSLTTDDQGRLFLVWVDDKNGDIFFSWANSSRASIPLEWTSPSILPTPAKLIGAPDILVDGSGSILVSYAVTLNENRGVYMVRSNNLGETWSAPSLVFDAMSVGWSAIDQPKLALTVDGGLHVIFTEYSVAGEIQIQPVGLYYLRSGDGGQTWRGLTELSDRPVSWREIIADNNQSLHVLWQEKYSQVTTVYHRNSGDGGLIWNNPIVVSSTRNELVKTDMAMDLGGQLHVLQLMADEVLGVQEWLWDGSRWTAQETKTILNKIGNTIPREFSAEIAPNGYLNVLTIQEVGDKDSILENNIISLSRHIAVVLPDQTLPQAVLPAPATENNPTVVPDFLATPTVYSPLAGVTDSGPVIDKNVVGLAMIIVLLILLVIVIRPTRSSKQD